MNGPINRFLCPIDDCEWSHDEPVVPELPADATPESLHEVGTARMQEVEKLLGEHFASHTLQEWVGAVSTLRQQLAQQQTIACLACVVAQHNARRDGLEAGPVNPAAVIANGAGICLDHLKISDGPVMGDRTRGGIVLPPGTMNGQG